MIPASRALDSDRRRIARLRVGVATAGALLAASVVVGSAATLGGFHSESIGAASDDARSITTAQLEWNPEADDASPFPRAVRLSTGAGESFQRDDMVSITAAGQGNDTCSAKAVVTRDGSRVLDVPFAACGVPLWELNGVEVTVSGPAGGRALKTNVGALSGALASFDGDVVRPANDTTAGYTTVGSGADASVATLRLAVDGAEGQAGFARTRNTGDRHEGIPRQVDVDVFQVVKLRIAHPDHWIVTRTSRIVRSRGHGRGVSHGGYSTQQTASAAETAPAGPVWPAWPVRPVGAARDRGRIPWL